MDLIEKYLADKLREREEAGNLRQLVVKRAAIDLFSNDYLGIATNKVLQKNMLQYGDDLSTGSTGSRLLSGNSREAEALERQIAVFHQTASALLFNSGYDANIGLLTSIANRHTVFIYDELCHASIIDGVRLSQSQKKFKFRHNDINDLEEKIKRNNSGHVVVVVESIYSMDGDMAPLHEIAVLADRYGAALIVDEAHATGVFGKHGEGLVQHWGLQEKVFARVHTFGKALGCHGAAIVGNELLKQYLINFARSFIYTTALPLHTIQSVSCAYQYLSAPEFSNESLHMLIQYFRGGIATLRKWKDSKSAIQALVVGDTSKTKSLSTALQAVGLQVNPILHPTVPLGMERLRVCLHTYNTYEQIDQLLEVVNKQYE